MRDTQLINLFQQARSDRSLAVIEGVQALKHAVRFKAEITHYITCDIVTLKDLLAELADDVKDVILSQITEVDTDTFDKLSPRPHRTNVIALAQRPTYTIADADPDKPIVLLENPKDLENIGAVVRASAAASAGAVIVTGTVNVWHPAVIRGAAGLHWALPVLNVDTDFLSHTDRQLISLDPTGENIDTTSIIKGAVLIFGTERHGISQQLLDQSDKVVRLPMRQGVSSLNLATSVSATLYQL